MPFFFQAFVDKINAVNIGHLTDEELAKFLNFLIFTKKKMKENVHVYLNFSRLERGEPTKEELKFGAEQIFPFRVALASSYFKENQEAGHIFLQKIKILLEKIEKEFKSRGEFLPGVREHGEEHYELLSYQSAMEIASGLSYSFDSKKYSDILSMVSFLKILNNSREAIAERFRSDNSSASLHALSLLEKVEESYEDEKINEILQTDLQKKYNFYAFGEATLMNTVRSSFKGVGRALFNKGIQRDYQIDFIEKVFDSLKNSNFDAEKKATYAYVILLKVQKQVGKERNVFSSGMNQLCVQLKKELKSALPLEKMNNLENDKSEYKKTLSEALKASREVVTKRLGSKKKF